MKPKKRYALCSHGVLVDAGTAKELAKKLGTAPGVICNYARDGLIYKKRYTFKEVGLANEKTAAAMKWAKEWDGVTERILKAGR